MFKKKTSYPVKTTLNLMVMERPAAQLKRMAPYIAVLAVLIALFCKFAVIDRLSAATRAENEAQAAERQLEQVQAQLVDYDAVNEEYTRYFSEALGASRAEMPLDVMEALALVEGHVMNQTNISSLDFEGDAVTMRIFRAGLDRASDLYAELTALPQVSSVSLYTANTGNAQPVEEGATILLTISFQEVTEP